MCSFSLFHSPVHTHTSPLPTTYTNYTITNLSSLPQNVSHALRALEEEYREGDLTEKGFLKRKTQLLEPFKQLMASNASVYFGTKAEKTEEREREGEGERREGGERREEEAEHMIEDNRGLGGGELNGKN